MSVRSGATPTCIWRSTSRRSGWTTQRLRGSNGVPVATDPRMLTGVLRDRWGPMKQTALALSHLVETRFRQDALQIIGFGLSAAPLTQVADLARYPITEKADIQANYARAISSAWRGRTLVKTTGGSTGDPFRFEYTMDSYARRTAVIVHS